jgi:hypothetical protein
LSGDVQTLSELRSEELAWAQAQELVPELVLGLVLVLAQELVLVLVLVLAQELVLVWLKAEVCCLFVNHQ